MSKQHEEAELTRCAGQNRGRGVCSHTPICAPSRRTRGGVGGLLVIGWAPPRPPKPPRERRSRPRLHLDRGFRPTFRPRRFPHRPLATAGQDTRGGVIHRGKRVPSGLRRRRRCSCSHDASGSNKGQEGVRVGSSPPPPTPHTLSPDRASSTTGETRSWDARAPPRMWLRRAPCRLPRVTGCCGGDAVPRARRAGWETGMAAAR